MARHFDIAIVNESVHNSLLQDPMTNIGVRIAGKANFLSIDCAKDSESGKKQGSFNPDNFQPMAEALNQGKAVILAAHNPADNFELKNGGYGVAYLSDICEGKVVILPVAIDLESEAPVGMQSTQLQTVTNKPSANVNIGEPFELSKIEGIDDLSVILGRRSAGQSLAVDRVLLSDLHTQLRAQSDEIMLRLAASLPDSKRGTYGTNTEKNTEPSF
ncbi:MAG TPA: hypothetical protein VMR16_03290 [Candidatus Saccharimonadales bacterium]|nr:hypothetical protein [Candidatus Saccharimonadales bacterium]